MSPLHAPPQSRKAMRRLLWGGAIGGTLLALTAGTGVAALVNNSQSTAAAACIPSGDGSAITAALKGAGAVAALCPGAVFTLSSPVLFTAPSQQLYTQGLPTDSTRAVLRIASASLTTAVDGGSQSGVTVENIQVDGNRAVLGHTANGGGALMEMGGAASDQTVQEVNAHDTRSWSTLHIAEGHVANNTPTCQNAKILNNQIGPAGMPSPTSDIADGISLACGHTLVQGNSVRDATDGGIVVFGAPGSTVQDNTVTAVSRQLLGGINMVDYAPMNGNYTGTVVSGNTITAQSAFIKVGLAMGQQVWNCTTGTDYGATVTGNTLQGAYMGYGYAVNGVTNWTVTGNTDSSKHVGTQTAGGCFGSPRASQMGSFQDDPTTTLNSTLQSQFTNATLTNVLSVTAPAIPNPGTAALATNPTSVAFATQGTGSTSAAKTVTVTNSGAGAATIASVSTSGDFRQTNTCGSTLAAGASCTVSTTFTPTAAGARSGTLTVTGNATNSPVTISLTGTGTGTSTGGPTDLALHRPVSASGSTQTYTPAKAVDADTSSYWESTNNAFPQWLQVDLGTTQAVTRLVLDLPPATTWGTRTQTLQVQGSTNGTAFTTLSASAGHTFNPATGNTATITLPAGTSTRYLRVTFTGNTGWPVAQLSELQAF